MTLGAVDPFIVVITHRASPVQLDRWKRILVVNVDAIDNRAGMARMFVSKSRRILRVEGQVGSKNPAKIMAEQASTTARSYVQAFGGGGGGGGIVGRPRG
ncbi:hypothetical protein NL676_025992 [Syzygium grande]|nr:hypothetical protein NL676_025992 [Syzygium grande]